VGCETYGTASPSKHEYLKGAGLDHAIDYRSMDFEAEVKRLTGGQGVDVCIDAQGGDALAKSFRCLRPTGRLFAFGAASLQPDGRWSPFAVLKGLLGFPLFALHPVRLMNENKGIFGVNMGHLFGEIDRLGAELTALLALYEAGAIKPVIDLRVPFSEAPEAHRRLQTRQNIGKVLLIP
jgi:NADPH:quinone reductase-like Zn-dependent oxidoreductase